jgi:hypothetical protein
MSTSPTSAHLDDERMFLEASLADAEREHEAGDLSDEDYRVLRRRDQDRLDEVRRELARAETSGGADDPTPRRNGASPRPHTKTRRASRRRLALGLGGVALVIVGAVVLVLHLTSSRLPGQTPTGSVQLSQAQRINQELAQADALLQSNNVQGAITLYGDVLSEDPDDPAALAQLGWLTYEQGVLRSDTKTTGDGRRLVEKAIASDRAFGPAHLYEGVILLRTAHDPAGAVGQFRMFLKDHPSKQNLENGAPFIREAFADEHLAPPVAVANASSGG